MMPTQKIKRSIIIIGKEKVEFVLNIQKVTFILTVQAPPFRILSRVESSCVIYKTGFGLDDYIDYRQYSAIADLHTLQFTATHALSFSVFTSRILATDL
jgi:hypothetical protein